MESFKLNLSSYWKWEILRGGLFLVLMGAAAVPTIFAVRRSDSMGFDTTSIIVVSASYAVIAVLMYYVLVPLRKRCLRKLQAECLGCGRLLLGKHSDSVLATGRCPVCGNRVVQ
jgi:hypothetical protein